MPTKRKKRLKQYTLDANRVARVRRSLGLDSDEEALEHILQFFIDNERLNRAHRKFVSSGAHIVDTLGRLEP